MQHVVGAVKLGPPLVTSSAPRPPSAPQEYHLPGSPLQRISQATHQPHYTGVISSSCVENIMKNTVPEIKTCTLFFGCSHNVMVRTKAWHALNERGFGGRGADQNTHLQPSKC